MDGRSQYGNFKVKKETAIILQEAKRAIQAFYDNNEITNDELISKLIEMAKAGNSSFEVVYNKVLKDNKDLLILAKEEKKKQYIISLT